MSAAGIMKLLWDKVHMVPTTAYGIDPEGALNKATTAMFRDVFAAELSDTIELTQTARDLRYPSSSAAKRDLIKGMSNEEVKHVADHESGSKLREKLSFAKEVETNLGQGFAADKDLLGQGEALAAKVLSDQTKNSLPVFQLVGPVIPTTIASVVLGVLVTCLRARFHQIGIWIEAADAGATGNIPHAQSLLYNLWLGHMLIKAIELPVSTFESYAKKTFNQAIKNGVLKAMMRQDYEYFDKNAPGVLQERLNRDSNELGENLLGFPKKMMEKGTWVLANLYIVYTQSPLPFFLVAILPVCVQVTTQYFAFRFFQRESNRERKIEEENAAATSEMLRQIKTVRQFAMESRAGSEYAATGLSTQIIAQGVFLTKRIMEAVVWMFFDSGIALTLLVGFPYVASGQMSAAILIDCFCKLNFNINFCLREICEEVPRIAKLLEPLGRICDLLESSPLIEPGENQAFVDCADTQALDAVLGACVTDASAGVGAASLTRVAVDGGLGALCSCAQRTADAAAKAASVDGGCSSSSSNAAAATTIPARGAQLLHITTADHQHIIVTCKDAIDIAELTFPVRAIFSSKLRPARFAGKIEFRDVHFSYPTDLRTPALQGMNFTVEPGQKVALVGASGCGKSSCMLLLQRFYDPLEGSVLIDGRNIQEYDINYLRSRVVIVDQSTILFNRTIKDNITYGMTRDVTDQEVIQALKDAQIWDFVDEKPDKLLTMISGNGSNLSGGEKQRLAIARAIIRKPDIILLDEATSALDNENEVKVQKALDILAKHGSALVIAHRLGTIKDSDKICVVDKGVVVEEGTHAMLIAAADADSNARPVTPTATSTRAATQDCDPDFTLKHVVDAAAKFPRRRTKSHPCSPVTRRRSSCPSPELFSNSAKSIYNNSAQDGVATDSSAPASYKKLWEIATGSKTTNMSIQSLDEKMA